MAPDKRPKIAKPIAPKDGEVSPVAVVEELGIDLDRGGGEIIEKVVYVNRSAKVVKGGRRFHFSALVVAGDRRGHVGWGFGKANEVADAIRKGTDQAKKSMVTINRRNSTIPHEVIGVFGGGRVLLRPASPGTGVIAGGGVRAVIEAAGVRDVLTKSLGSSNAVNVVKATIDALLQLRPREEIFRVRGFTRQAATGVS
jgi:small subunit ribosomal protein S5